MKHPKINKKHVLQRLTLVPDKDKRFFYAREMKFLNDLCDRYSLEFMSIVSFPQKFDSLAYLVSPKLKKTLDRKFFAFNFKVDESRYEDYHIGDKVGPDASVKPRKKNIKDFLE